MIDKTSIIVVAWDTQRIQRMITSACLGNITKFTNRDEYELIFVDQAQERGMDSLDSRHHIFTMDKYVPLSENIGCSAAMNLGFKNSNQEYKYICFIHSDVFVPDNWLPKLVSLSAGKNVIMPTQGKMTREMVLDSYTNENLRAWDDAGLVLMPRDVFIKSGGWDERFKAIYQDAIFRLRFGNEYLCTNRVIITHIGGIGYYCDAAFESSETNREGPLYNSTRDEINNGVPQPNYL